MTDIPHWMAIHEAGHVVVADALGLTVTGVASDDDQIAVTTSPSPGFISATVSHAGGLAQHRFGEMPGHGTLTDLRHAKVDIELAAGGRGAPESVIYMLTLRASNLAKNILDARWELVESIAELILANDGNVGHEALAIALMPRGEFMDIGDDPGCDHCEAT